MKKKKKLKGKYAQGGLTQNNPYMSDQERKIEEQGTAIAESIPVVGQYAQIGSQISSGIRGDETSGVKNVIGDNLGGFNTVKAIQSGNYEEAIPIYGGFAKAKRRRGEKAEMEALEARKLHRENLNRSSAVLSGYDSHGKGNFAKGGYLSRISNSAMEVKADNPSKTDSVELPNAFVDNNEIIDNQQRVFSDDLTLPNGRSIAKEAKKLEKMKKDGYTAANSRIEDRLNKLFAHQQTLNGNNQGDSFAIGGEMRRKPAKKQVDPNPPEESFSNSVGEFFREYLPYGKEITRAMGYDPEYQAAVAYQSQPEQVARQQAEIDRFKATMEQNKLADNKNGLRKGGYIKASYNEGGARVPLDSDFQGQGGGGMNFNQIANFAGTYGSNIANAFALSKVPEAPEPVKENKVYLERINDRAEQAELGRMSRLQRLAASKNTAQSSAANARAASILGGTLSAKNALSGQTSRSNAEIASREAAMNLGVGARNAMSETRYRENKIDRLNRIAALRSQNLADVANKSMSQRAERNQKDVDKARLDVIKTMYDDSGVYDRNFEERLKQLMELQNKRG